MEELKARLIADEDELKFKSHALAEAYRRETDLRKTIHVCNEEILEKDRVLQAKERELARLVENSLALWIKSQLIQLIEKRRLLKDRKLILSSGLLKPDWYYASYPDVQAAGVDPATHFVKFGAKEGRNPGPFFNTTFYLDSNPDVARSGVNPLIHYLKYGKAEGRAPTPN